MGRDALIGGGAMLAFQCLDAVLDRVAWSSGMDTSAAFRQLSGITKSLNDKSYEFVIHVKEERDYRLKSETQ